MVVVGRERFRKKLEGGGGGGGGRRSKTIRGGRR